MSSWFDRLLEELQRRQAEQDARREGRPSPPRDRRGPRDRYGSPTPGEGDDGPDLSDGDPTPLRRRRGTRGAGGGGPGPFGGPLAGGDWGDWSRYRRWILIGLALVVLLVVLGLAGGLVNLLTDLQWFSALGLSSVLTTRLWAQVGLFVAGYAAFAVPAVVSVLIARRLAPRVPVRRLGGLELLGALLLLVIAAGYQLDIAELSYSTRGVGGAIQAATYADLHAQQPAYVILTGVAILAAILVLANIWFRTLWLLVFAAAGWILLSVVVGGIYPTIVQNLQVSPNERALEQPYIANNIASTRAAFDLDAVAQRTFTGSQPLSRALFTDNAATLQNIRLWDYRPLLDTLGQQQQVYQYYAFRDVDIDRYRLDDKERQIMLAGRELDTAKLVSAAQTWTNEHLVYTHGYGITAVPVNAVTPEGAPDYPVSGINQQAQLPAGERRVYFGEGQSTYVIVGTQTGEFDYPVGNNPPVTTSWKGSTAVGIGGFFNR